MNEEKIKELFEYAVKEKGVQLIAIQEHKLKAACERAINENEDDYSRKIAIKIYLNFILEFPDLSL